MAQITTLQFNHDCLTLHGSEAVASWANDILAFLRRGSKDVLPDGVRLVEEHHSVDAPAYMMLTAEDRNLIRRALNEYGARFNIWKTDAAKLVADKFNDERHVAAAPVCRICGEEGHSWQRCGND